MTKLTTISKPSGLTVLQAANKSYVLGGIVIVLLVNIILQCWQPLAKVDPESLPAAHTWIWWAAHEYFAQKLPPDIVILGSSIVMHPLSQLEARYLDSNLDYVHHHRITYLEDLLHKRLGLSNVKCFNFSLPGGMVSDCYIVTRSILASKQKPRMVVLGLNLRDFIDNGVSCPASTPAFRYLKRFVTIDDFVDLAMPQSWQRIEYYFGKLMYLWGKKLDVQVLLAEFTKHTCAPLITKFTLPCRLNELELQKNMPSNLRAEIEEGMFIVKKDEPYSYTDNSQEYKKRYRSPNGNLFENQTRFLAELLSLCQSEKIAVLLVNMPLTESNMRLMPTGSYDKYLQIVKDLSRHFSFCFIDLNNAHHFNKQDFYDGVHMNADGGRKLVEAMISTINCSKSLAQSLMDKHQLPMHLAGNEHPL